MVVAPGVTNLGAYRAIGNLPSPQAIELPMASSGSQYTKKESIYSKPSPEVDNPPFYKRFQLVFLNLSSDGDQVQCPKQVSECLATEPYPKSIGEKSHLNLTTTVSCLNTKNISTKKNTGD
jgi:hypothetical protein